MLKNQKTILIIGGAGYLGSVLVKKLFEAKSNYLTNNINEFNSCLFDKIIVYDNLMYKQNSLIEHCYRDDFEFVYGNVRDWELLKNYIDVSDVILPLAAIVGFPACEKDKHLATQVNFSYIKNIVDYCKKKKSDVKIIYPNTNSGYGITNSIDVCTEKDKLNPISHYGITKASAEKYIISNNMGISFRLATVFGISNRMRLDLLVNDFVYKAFTDKYIVLFEKDFKRNYIHIQDVAYAFIYMINNYDKYKGEIFNVGLSSANLSKYELCLKIKEQLPNFSIQFDNISEDMDKRNYIVSSEKLEKTGWKPTITLESGIKELIKAYTILSQSNKNFSNN